VRFATPAPSRKAGAVGGYAFGDSALAARRLALLAEVFEPTSRAFLAHVGAHLSGPPPELAVDLGCGPGHTTRLLVSVLGPRRVLGLDQSASFVALAAADAPPGAEFAVHDVTAVPFPCPPAGLLSCRFLLGHLPDPAAALAAWRRVAPEGRLVLFEGLWGGADPVEQLREQAREGLRRLRGEPDHHHDRYHPSVVEELPLAAGTHPDQVVELVEAAGWGPARLERLRDIEWAQLVGLPTSTRLLGVTPRFAVVAG